MIKRIRVHFAGLLIALLIPFAGANAQDKPEDSGQGLSPIEVIEAYYGVLHDAMQRAKELGFEGRYELLMPTIERTFNMDYIAEFALGRYWKKLDEEQRATVTDGMKRLSTATYAARFDDYSGEQFHIIEEKKIDGGDLLVYTNIIDSKGKPVGINYVLRRKDDQWLIIDVYLKGTYSELATRRAEFTSVMRREGYDALVAVIDKKVANLKSES